MPQTDRELAVESRVSQAVSISFVVNLIVVTVRATMTLSCAGAGNDSAACQSYLTLLDPVPGVQRACSQNHQFEGASAQGGRIRTRSPPMTFLGSVIVDGSDDGAEMHAQVVFLFPCR